MKKIFPINCFERKCLDQNCPACNLYSECGVGRYIQLKIAFDEEMHEIGQRITRSLLKNPMKQPVALYHLYVFFFDSSIFIDRAFHRLTENSVDDRSIYI